MRRSARLSTRILASQLTILLITMVIGFVLYLQHTRGQLDDQYEKRALVLAQSVAAMPQVRSAVAAGHDTDAVVAAVAAQITAQTGASYVVVITADGVRLSHPNPALIGKPIEEPVVALDGKPHVGIDPGSLGPSANGKAPVFAPDSTRPVGEVSAGILETQVAGALWQQVPAIVLYTGLALAFGAAVSLVVARNLKKITFGLELHEIAALLQEREAMLHGVREGVVTMDVDGRITLINDEARRLLGVLTSALGSPVDAVLPDGRLRDVLTGRIAGPDQIVLTEKHCLLANRMRVGPPGRPLGSVVTLRDRTEIEALLRELTNARGLSDALRAQQHEFSNRLHTVIGLLSLGEPEEALRYLTETTDAVDGFADSVRSKIDSPVLAALIVAKSTVAAERGVTLLLADDSGVHRELPDTTEVITIVGNLVDNAIDAATLGPPPAHVTVCLRDNGSSRTIRVSDTGPGIPPELAQSIFEEGYTTKSSRGAGQRGIGLALVRKIVQRVGGEITVSDGPGPVFTITLPDPGAVEPAAQPDGVAASDGVDVPGEADVSEVRR